MAIQTKVISVVGATGAQGGSVVRSLIHDADFEIRAITRDQTTPNARALAELGVPVVQAGGGDQHEMQSALAGSWGVFINVATEGMSFEEGVDLGIHLLSSAAAAGVKHVVFSSAPYAAKLSSGQAPVPTLDVKAKTEEWGQACAVFETFTPVMAAWYLENFEVPLFAELMGGFPLIPDREGYLSCRTPLWGGKEQVPFISVKDDFGDLVHGIFLNPVRWNRRVVQCNGELMSWSDLVQTFAAVTGQRSRFLPYVPAEEMPSFPFGSVQDLFIYAQLRDGEYYGNGPSEVETARALKKAAWRAKGCKGRETMMTVKEFFQREYPTKGGGVKR